MVFFFDILIAPFPKLDDNMTGNNKGVIPIAMATEKVNAIRTLCLFAVNKKVIGIITNINFIRSLLKFSVPN